MVQITPKSLKGVYAMKKIMQVSGLVLVATLLHGCFIQSFQPFYTEKTITKLPAINGKWQLTRIGENDVSKDYKQPWSFSENQIETFQKDVSSIVNVTYFKIEDTTFADISPREPDPGKGPNSWWTIHTISVHSACRVNLSTNSMSFTPLDGEWVKKMLKNKELSLKYTSVDKTGDHLVLTGTPDELTEFLKINRNNEKAFPKALSHNFTRSAERDGNRN